MQITGSVSSVVTYTVTYNGNGSTGGTAPTDPNSPYASGATVTVLGAGTLVKSGNTFAGWNTAANGSGTSYAASATFAIAANTTLYAQWTPVTTYTVTYNGNGNTGGTAPTDPNSPYASGATVTVLNNTGSLVKTGNTFAGWTTNSDGSGTVFTAGNTFTISVNTTLYAKWTASGAASTTTTIGYNTGYSSPTTYGDAVGFKATVTPTPDDGVVVTFKDGATTLGTGTTAGGVATYATTASQLAAGTHSAITATFAGNSSFASSTSSALSPAHVVNPKALSITAPTIADKSYDGTTTAGTVTPGTLSGFVSGETVTATGLAANYSSANVGTYSSVITYTLANGTGGGLAANYSLASGTASGNIIAKALTITANSVSKDVGATLTGGAGSTAYTITSGSFAGAEGSGVTVTIAYGSGAAAGDAIGTYTGQVTASAATGGTFAAANYSISYAPGNITVLPPLVAGWDFQTTTGGGTAAVAATNSPLVYTANFGSGTIYLDGEFGSSNWTSLSSSPQVTAFAGTAVNADTAIGFSTSPTNISGVGCLALANSSANGQTIVFQFSMTNRVGLVVSYATQRTGTSFTNQLWEYSTDGTTWTPSLTNSSIPTSFATVTLPTITGLNGASTAYLRLTVSGATSTSGNNRLDNIQIRASAATSVTLSGSKVYDGTTTVPAASLTVVNNADGGNLTLSGSVTLASANGGLQSIIATNNLSLGGSAAGNYTLTGASGSVRINPAPGALTITTISNMPVSFPTNKLVLVASDAGVTLSVTGVSSTSTNGGTVSLSGANIIYSPVTSYTGADSFTYTLSDDQGGSSTGTVSVPSMPRPRSPGRASRWCLGQAPL